jgi:hypothetical protein
MGEGALDLGREGVRLFRCVVQALEGVDSVFQNPGAGGASGSVKKETLRFFALRYTRGEHKPRIAWRA